MRLPIFDDASILVSVGVFLTHQFETAGVFTHLFASEMQRRRLSGALSNIACLIASLATVAMQPQGHE